MAKTTKELSEVYFDTRTRSRYMAKGLISQKDYESFLTTLPNDEDNFELAPFEDDDLEIAAGADSESD